MMGGGRSEWRPRCRGALEEGGEEMLGILTHRWEARPGQQCPIGPERLECWCYTVPGGDQFGWTWRPGTGCEQFGAPTLRSQCVCVHRSTVGGG